MIHEKQSFFEQSGGTYTQVGDVLIPNLTVEETKPIGRWGHMRRRYLREHHPAVYSNMLLGGTLYQHLAEIDKAADERINLITKQLADKRGITEKVKSANQLLWVQEMNSIRASAEETILAELIYAL
ncbi:MAG: TnpV protein [Oscillospiraceae bacterium]|nr:TnpV protein [Oscillospiraceae bacterium]